jgi:hypothetical protein
VDKRTALTFAALSLSLAACTPSSVTRKLSDDAYNVAMAERFGRMDIVSDMVAASRRDDFVASHSQWGRSIRIVDLEYAGLRVAPDDKANVELIVSWQRLDEVTLRTTTLIQTWAHNDRWEIVEEKRVGGDRGLIDEPDAKIDDTPKTDGKKYRQLSRADAPADAP